MRRTLLNFLIAILAGIVVVSSCTHKPKAEVVTPDDGNFPGEVAKIFVSKCAVSGCHNAASYQNAAGLRLDSWDNLFKGGNAGAEVIAYSAHLSPLLYFVNTDSTRGIVATPTMPQSTTTMPMSPLTRDEYNTLYNWIAAGAPDKNGNIPFASLPDTRQKIYLTNQGCDLLAVIDAKSRVVMRYIKIGVDSTATESPHDVEVSDDGRYAYVPFYNGSWVQKIDTRTDAVVGSTNVSSRTLGGLGQWSVIHTSPQDTEIMVSGLAAPGYIVAINTASMLVNPNHSVDQQTGGTSLFPYPHGLESNAAYDTFYATLQYGDNIAKYTFSSAGILNNPQIIEIAPPGSFPNPHQIAMSPDGSRYFITCQASGEVRVFDAHKDTLLAAIRVGTDPQEMTFSPAHHYLFVACMEDAANPLPGRRGSVYVIDYNTLQLVSVLYGDFFQPHDVAVDEQDGLVYIPSRNATADGPAPHHATSCNGRAGWYTVYDLNTLQPADNKRYEVTVDPYAIDTRFH